MTNGFKCYLCGYERPFTDKEAKDDLFCLAVRDAHRLRCSKSQ